MGLLQSIITQKNNKRKLFAILIDPDKGYSDQAIEQSASAGADVILVGGSLLTNGSLDKTIAGIRKRSSLPVYIFPGDHLQVNNNADGILLLSLISGRNPDLLIGRHVLAAPALRKSGLDIIPTGYILIDGGKSTAASYMSGTVPVPADQFDIAACTALAGELLGLKLIYLDAGSGALNPVNPEMIRKVAASVSLPIITGGGINTPEKAELACAAGADMVVVGNAFEKDPALISEIAAAIHSTNVIR